MTTLADPKIMCPECGTTLDEDGYCTDVGCPRCGKTAGRPARTTATVNYTTHRGRSVSLYNVPYTELRDVLRRLWQARMPAFAHERTDIEDQVGGVSEHPETRRLSWWSE